MDHPPGQGELKVMAALEAKGGYLPMSVRELRRDTGLDTDQVAEAVARLVKGGWVVCSGGGHMAGVECCMATAAGRRHYLALEPAAPTGAPAALPSAAEAVHSTRGTRSCPDGVRTAACAATPQPEPA